MKALSRDEELKDWRVGTEVWTWDNTQGLLYGSVLNTHPKSHTVDVEWFSGEVEYGLSPKVLSVVE